MEEDSRRELKISPAQLIIPRTRKDVCEEEEERPRFNQILQRLIAGRNKRTERVGKRHAVSANDGNETNVGRSTAVRATRRNDFPGRVFDAIGGKDGMVKEQDCAENGIGRQQNERD